MKCICAFLRHITVVLLLGIPLSAAAIESDADGWYITRSPASNQDFVREHAVKAEMQEKMADCLKTFGMASKSALNKEFDGKIFISVFDPLVGVPRVTHASDEEGAATKAMQQKGAFQVVLYGSHASQSPRVPALFSYDEEWEALFVPALAMSKPWFCAEFLHGLYHASKHRARKSARTASVLPESALADAEVRARELARDVLNASTFGNYQRMVMIIVDEAEETSLEKIHAGIERLRQGLPDTIATLFPPAPPNEIEVRRTQLLIDVTLLHAEKKGGASEKRRAFLAVAKKYGS